MEEPARETAPCANVDWFVVPDGAVSCLLAVNEDQGLVGRRVLAPELDRQVVLLERVDLHGEAQVCEPGRRRLKRQRYPARLTGVPDEYRVSTSGEPRDLNIHVIRHDDTRLTVERVLGFGLFVAEVHEILPVVGVSSSGVLRVGVQADGG
ncbi:hypothetical protein [Arthrobacter sp. W4I7]|uniref:hypothetical protein n=1 Tax=Arthrobacter sp. W4I7 TaxID=3042296 RepID=UPI002780D743|nr:hypothetical protein [Arthrobacter sp. W4I7]MDQ0691176.1 hypothetical protein [Arthrobacter sp. W4I7]